MKQHFKTVSAAAAILTIAACASPGSTPQAPGGAAAASAPTARANDYGNIRWNKPSLHLFKSKGAQTALLSFWAKNGYFTYPMSCQNGGKVVATPGKVGGNPNRYDHVKYSFVAKTGKVDQCQFMAVLNNTGSPPIATITLYLNS